MMKSSKYVVAILLSVLLPLFLNAGVEIRGSSVFKYTAQKGEVYSAVVKIHNPDNKDQEVNIYQTDYLFNYKGEAFYDKPGTLKRSNAIWIKFAPKTLVLKANETQSVLVEVTVPRNDTLSGTYWSVIMIEGVRPPDPNIKVLFALKESVRYAIQIITNIGKTGKGGLEFQNVGVVKEANHSFLDFVLLNCGERLISPDVSMELFDMATGESVKIIKAPKNGMYPGTSTKWRFALEGIPTKKTYKAVIVADGLGEDVFGMESTLEL